MGFIANYLQQRRRKKLEAVNKELERLKEFHPFDPGTLKPRNNYGTYAADHHSRNQQRPQRSPSFFSLIILGLIFLFMIVGVFFYYQGQMDTLQEAYDRKNIESSQFQTKVDDLTEELEDTKHELKKKTVLGFNLSDQSDQLRREKQSLEQEIADLEKDIINKEANLINLNTTMSQKVTEIVLWKACIKKIFNEDPNDCNITSS
jgi:cell division protein FtsB